MEDVDGHALTLQVIGQFLVRAFHGDIRRRDRVDLQKADAKIQGGHAFRAMEAYVKWLEDDSEESRREVALLKLLGLFDRPATADCVAALRQSPAIPSLTEPLVGLPEDDWEFSLTSLRDAKLLTVNREQGSGDLVTLDAHPLLREYFAQRVREQQPEAWRAAHRRLYEHLCATTKEGYDPTLEDLQPLYQAVAHGCQAGLQQEALHEVYHARLQCRNERYSTFKLGAVGSDLGAIACFFETPWSRLSPTLKLNEQAWLLNEAAYRLRALGRLTEALEPMRAGLEMRVKQQDWANAAGTASNLSELELILGEVAVAVRVAGQAMAYADRSGSAFQRQTERVVLADALHYAGRRDEAQARFREAEEMQQHRPQYPYLYSGAGFRYCDLLLTEAERAAWQRILRTAAFTPLHRPNEKATAHDLERRSGVNDALRECCRAVSKRAARALKIVLDGSGKLLDIGLNHLTLGSAALYEVIIGRPEPTLRPSVRDAQQRVPTDDELSVAHRELDAAVVGLRRAGLQDDLARGLLTRAWLCFLTGARTGPESAQADLDEAWEIAERGPMKLFMADIHLYRARLFHGVRPYPWTSPQDDLAAARKLIEQCGYWRRKEELEDAEAAAKNW